MVDKVERAPSGKPDYRWATDVIDRRGADAAASGAGPRLPTDLSRTGGGPPHRRRDDGGPARRRRRSSTIPELANEAESLWPRAGGRPASASRRGRRVSPSCTALPDSGPTERAPRGTLRSSPRCCADPTICSKERRPSSSSPTLGPEPSDYVSARRHGVSPFGGTSLDATLRGLGVTTVVATGVSLNLGIPGLAIEAVNLGYRVVLPQDAVCGVPADYADGPCSRTRWRSWPPSRPSDELIACWSAA